MPSTPPTVRAHFETPEIVLASESTARSGLWDVELSALGADVHAGCDGAAGVGDETGDVSDDAARGTVLVDLGCGAGRSSIALAPFFAEIVLMDLSSDARDCGLWGGCGARRTRRRHRASSRPARGTRHSP